MTQEKYESKIIGLGIPVTGIIAALRYYDSMRANLIQAHRDYFGAHTYERVNKRVVFHTVWGEE